MYEERLEIFLEPDKSGINDALLRIRINGDPLLICKMLRTAMQSRQDIAAAFIAAVVDYAQQEGFWAGDLENMVTFDK
jgi:hypothetical protein